MPLFLISAAYSALRIAVAPLPSSGPYKMYWDTGVLSTLWTYWKMALGLNRLILIGIYPSPARSFLIVLAPVLPVRDHIYDYYLTVPMIGLAMWGSWALVSGWRAGAAGRIASVSLLIVYFAPVGLSRQEPGRVVLLKGVDTTMFWDVVYNRPFRLFGMNDLFLVPEDQHTIVPEDQHTIFRRTRATHLVIRHIRILPASSPIRLT